jgi:hypothetical protein
MLSDTTLIGFIDGYNATGFSLKGPSSGIKHSTDLKHKYMCIWAGRNLRHLPHVYTLYKILVK